MTATYHDRAAYPRDSCTQYVAGVAVGYDVAKPVTKRLTANHSTIGHLAHGDGLELGHVEIASHVGGNASGKEDEIRSAPDFSRSVIVRRPKIDRICDRTR